MRRATWLRSSMLGASLSTALIAWACGPDPAPVAIGQGAPTVEQTAPRGVGQGTPEGWTTQFYTVSQGSSIMPLDWIRALKLPDGSPFMADSLRRYGFLPNDDNLAKLPNDDSPAKLPVGFTSAKVFGQQVIGMNCAACHTREIEVSGIRYRIDGGPAIIDLQTFFSDLDSAVGRVLYDPAFA